MTSWVRTAGALAAGLVLGAAATLAIQSSGVIPVQHGANRARAGATAPIPVPERPNTVLAWVPSGIPPDFADRVRALPGGNRTRRCLSNHRS